MATEGFWKLRKISNRRVYPDVIGTVWVDHQAQVEGLLLSIRAVSARESDEKELVVTDRRQARQQW